MARRATDATDLRSKSAVRLKSLLRLASPRANRANPPGPMGIWLGDGIVGLISSKHTGGGLAGNLSVPGLPARSVRRFNHQPTRVTGIWTRCSFGPHFRPRTV